jgi:hypothetical protein
MSDLVVMIILTIGCLIGGIFIGYQNRIITKLKTEIKKLKSCTHPG